MQERSAPERSRRCFVFRRRRSRGRIGGMVWIRRDEARRISIWVHVGETAWDGVRIEAVPFIAGRADWRGRERATRRGHGRRARARGRRRGRRQGGTGRAPPPCASDRDWPDSAISLVTGHLSRTYKRKQRFALCSSPSSSPVLARSRPPLRRVGPSTLLRRYQDIDCSRCRPRLPSAPGLQKPITARAPSPSRTQRPAVP